MKRSTRIGTLLITVCILTLVGTVLLTGSGCEKDSKSTINVFSWGEYIEPDLLPEFEEQTGIHINYTTVATCEEMYAKMKNGGITYDIVVPSDYMIQWQKKRRFQYVYIMTTVLLLNVVCRLSD